MNDRLACLFEHEKEVLLSALRRDLEAERAKADLGVWSDYHGFNAQVLRRILAVLGADIRNGSAVT